MERKKLEEIQKYFEELKALGYNKIQTSKSFMSIEKYSYDLNNGKTIIREKLIKNGSDGSAAITLPITKDNKVILAIEPRVFTEKTVDMGLPAGYIEPNEAPENAAKRELLEETGYTSNNFVSLGSFYQDQGCSAAYNYYYVAFDCEKIKEQDLDEGEFIKYILVDIDDLDMLIDKEYITGLNSAYVIEKAKKYIRERRIKNV